MANSRKQIAFDLDTKALEKYYPNKSWNAYIEKACQAKSVAKFMYERLP